MEICSPKANAVTPKLTFADRPKTLEGLRIGLLDNKKAPVDKMWVHLEKRLLETIPKVKVFSISKKGAAHPAEPHVMKALKDNCDVVINALGD